MDAQPLRLLIPAPTTDLQTHWDTPRTLTQWIAHLETTAADVSGNASTTTIANITDPSALSTLFYANQRTRFLLRILLNRWRHRTWSRREPQCGVDLIMNEPVPPTDAIHLTDTRNRTIYCFHYRDLFTNLLTKISNASEMLPTPLQPTNPWTNQPLTFAQTIAVCQALLRHYASRGRCPPTLFAAFCAARYDLRRFETDNASLLAQYAIAAYFKDLHEHNHETVTDTALELLRDANVRYSAVAFRRWFRQRPLTPIHHEWLALVRDYTLHMNLHIQPRRSWHVEDNMYADVVALYRRTPLENPAGPRMRLLHTTPSNPLSMAVIHLGGLSGLSGGGLNIPLDTSGNLLDSSGDTAIDLEAQATAALLLLLQQSFGAP